jgi:hypothetical protein
MIHWSHMTLQDIVFTHTDLQGVIRHFAVSRLLPRLNMGDVHVLDVAIKPEDAYHAWQHHGIEQHRYARITAKHLRHPIVFAEFEERPQTTHCLIGGNHRFVWAAMHGYSSIKAFMVPQRIWEDYLIDIPEEISRMASEDIMAGTAKSYIP